MAKGRRSEKKEKNNSKILIIIVIVVVIAILGFSLYKLVEYKSKKLLDGYLLYEATNYTIQYKNDWTRTANESVPNMMVFSSPNKLGIINVITENLTTKYTLDQYVDDSIANLKTTLNLTTEDIGKEKCSIIGTSAYRISYNANETTKIIQTIFLSNMTAYIISYNCAVDYFDVYHNMENTLVIK